MEGKAGMYEFRTQLADTVSKNIETAKSAQINDDLEDMSVCKISAGAYFTRFLKLSRQKPVSATRV